MKITKKQLQKIIQEEIYQILKEHETEDRRGMHESIVEAVLAKLIKQ